MSQGGSSGSPRPDDRRSPAPRVPSQNGCPPGWYRDFMRPAYWPIADTECTRARTARELAYLARRLPAGAAVLDAGCGLGRHSIGLARRGWPVIGVDCRADVLGEARRRAAVQGAGRPRFVCADLFADAPLREGSVAAAVCMQAFGWGTEADQRALLDGLCRMLVPGGLLILDVTSPAWIASSCPAAGTAEIDGVRYLFDCSYDVIGSRSRGSIAAAGSPADPIRHDIRHYTPPEITRLLAEAGFAVQAVDAEFAVGEPAASHARYLQYVALRRPPVLRKLAAAGHHEYPRGTRLDLRWVVEEPQLHARPLAELWNQAVASTEGFERARDYRLDDPYGAGRLAGPLRAAGLPVEPENLAAGAGVSALLAAVAGMARGRPVLCAAGGYPDLAVWAAMSGGQVTVAGRVTPSAVPTAGLVCLDCPSVEGERLEPRAVRDIARRCEDLGTMLVIDESYGTYLEPGQSLADVALGTRGTLLLAGLSKGYGLGGVRVGWAIGSAQAVSLLRRHLPPLQAASASLAFAALVLRERGLLDPLRARVRTAKPRFVQLLAERGIAVRAGHPALPWVGVPARDAARLAGIGIAGKPGTSLDAVMWRLAVPLSDDRRQLAATLLNGLERAADGGVPAQDPGPGRDPGVDVPSSTLGGARGLARCLPRQACSSTIHHALPGAPPGGQLAPPGSQLAPPGGQLAALRLIPRSRATYRAKRARSSRVRGTSSLLNEQKPQIPPGWRLAAGTDLHREHQLNLLARPARSATVRRLTHSR